MVNAVGKRLFFGGNWKADMTLNKTRQWIKTFRESADHDPAFNAIVTSKTRIMIAPPSISLQAARDQYDINYLETRLGFGLGVQDPWHKSGAYTGATTFEAAKELGVKYAVIGHSETREPWRIISEAISKSSIGSTDLAAHNAKINALEKAIMGIIDIAGEKTKSFRVAIDGVINHMVHEALKADMAPILCIGETLEERQAGRTNEVVLSQLNAGLAGLTPEQIAKAIVAYEPVWAIGTNETATPEQAEEVHLYIFNRLVSLTSEEIAASLPIIYGGSMKPRNVADLVSQPHISGGLIGGASLNPDVFLELILNGIQAVAQP